MDQTGAGDRAGIDHRIEGMVFGIEADRIEGIAGRLDADRVFHPRRAERIQRQREHERLRHRLDREGYPGVADLIDVPVEGGEADAEMIGVGLAEFRDVVGDGAAGLRGKIGVTGGQEPQQRRFRGGPAAGVLRSGPDAQIFMSGPAVRCAVRAAGCYVASAGAETGPDRCFMRQVGGSDQRARSREWRGPVLRRPRRQG